MLCLTSMLSEDLKIEKLYLLVSNFSIGPLVNGEIIFSKPLLFAYLYCIVRLVEHFIQTDRLIPLILGRKPLACNLHSTVPVNDDRILVIKSDSPSYDSLWFLEVLILPSLLFI